MVDGMLGSAVQLLTPEGERVSQPRYDISLTEAELRDLYRDMVMVRRLDAEDMPWRVAHNQVSPSISSRMRCSSSRIGLMMVSSWVSSAA